MSGFWRNLLCVFIGLISGYVGFLIVAIFWPLLFPQPIHGSSAATDTALIVVAIAFFSSAFVIGFLLCRKLSKKLVRDKGGITELFR